MWYNKIAKAALLAAAVGLLIFTVVFVVPSARGADSFDVKVLNLSETECVGLQNALASGYSAAREEIELKELQDYVRSKLEREKPEVTEFVVRAVSQVYAEYPETETGRRIILECFANAKKGPAI